MPAERGGIPQQIVVPAEEILRDERRFSGFQVAPYFREDRKAAGKIIVRQEKAGPPDLQQTKEEEAAADRHRQQLAAGRRVVPSQELGTENLGLRCSQRQSNQSDDA